MLFQSYISILKSNTYSVSAVRHCGEMRDWGLLKMGHACIWSLKTGTLKLPRTIVTNEHEWHFECNYFPLFRTVLSIVRALVPLAHTSQMPLESPRNLDNKTPGHWQGDCPWLRITVQSYTCERLHPFKCPLEIRQLALHMHPQWWRDHHLLKPHLNSTYD